MILKLIDRANYLLVTCCFLLSLPLNAQQLNVLLDGTVNCAANSYCVSVQLQSNSSLEIGTSSIFLDYNEAALSFNSYTSSAFDGSALCIANAANAWDVHTFDGNSVPGDFNLTMTLLNNSFSCPSIANTPVEVGVLCFNILDAKADPTISVNIDNTQFNSAATNDGTNAIGVASGNDLSGALLDCSVPCIGEGGDSDNDGVCDPNDQCPNFDDALLGQPCDDGDPCTVCLLYTSPSPRDLSTSRMPSSA